MGRGVFISMTCLCVICIDDPEGVTTKCLAHESTALSNAVLMRTQRKRLEKHNGSLVPKTWSGREDR